MKNEHFLADISINLMIYLLTLLHYKTLIWSPYGRQENINQVKCEEKKIIKIISGGLYNRIQPGKIIGSKS